MRVLALLCLTFMLTNMTVFALMELRRWFLAIYRKRVAGFSTSPDKTMIPIKGEFSLEVDTFLHHNVHLLKVCLWPMHQAALIEVDKNTGLGIAKTTHVWPFRWMACLELQRMKHLCLRSMNVKRYSYYLVYFGADDTSTMENVK